MRQLQFPPASAGATALFNATTATSLAAADTNRKSLSIQVDPAETATLYILKGAGTVSTSLYSFTLSAGDYYEALGADVQLGFTALFGATPAKGALVTKGS